MVLRMAFNLCSVPSVLRHKDEQEISDRSRKKNCAITTMIATGRESALEVIVEWQ